MSKVKFNLKSLNTTSYSNYNFNFLHIIAMILIFSFLLLVIDNIEFFNLIGSWFLLILLISILYINNSTYSLSTINNYNFILGIFYYALYSVMISLYVFLINMFNNFLYLWASILLSFNYFSLFKSFNLFNAYWYPLFKRSSIFGFFKANRSNWSELKSEEKNFIKY